MMKPILEPMSGKAQIQKQKKDHAKKHVQKKESGSLKHGSSGKAKHETRHDAESKGLSVHDKQVLAIVNDAPVKDFFHFAARYMTLSSEEMQKSLEKLKKEGLIEILEVADSEDLRYFHTKKFSKEILGGIDALVKHA